LAGETQENEGYLGRKKGRRIIPATGLPGGQEGGRDIHGTVFFRDWKEEKKKKNPGWGWGGEVVKGNMKDRGKCSARVHCFGPGKPKKRVVRGTASARPAPSDS